MKKRRTLALLGAGVLLLEGCGSTQSTTASTATKAAEASTETISTQLVTNVYGDGQKPWYVALTYDRTISAESVSTDDDTVKNVYVNTDPSIDGTYVIVELSTNYTTMNYGGTEPPRMSL
ncbi:MAG: hypothetical protein PUE63_01245 [Lachnospiraceae bacterium]|nr:hypothetical protein [Lachnospiraceae bacterium]